MPVTILRPSQRLLVPGTQVLSGRPVAGVSIPAWADYPNVVAAYDAKNAASQAASYTNLANPGTYDLTVGSAPTWANGTGWTFDGTQYLLTGVIPVPGSWSMFVQFSNFVGYLTTFETPAGTVASSSRWFGFYALSTDKIRALVGSGIRDNSPSMQSGNYGISGNVPYRNGAAESLTVTVGTVNTVTEGITIGASRPTGSNPARITIRAIWIGSSTLSSGDVAALSAAMAAL